MDKLQESALIFEKLFNIDYYITAEKGGKKLELKVFFNEGHFHHIVGLHKLIDIPNISRVKGKNALFRNILEGQISLESCCKSDYFYEVEKRLEYFNYLEELLFNEIIVRFDKRKSYSSIRATFLLYKKIDCVFLHLFLLPFNNDFSDILVPNSFFPCEDNKYIVRQEKYKVTNVRKVQRNKEEE